MGFKLTPRQMWILVRAVVALSLLGCTMYLLTLEQTSDRTAAVSAFLTMLAMMARFYFDDEDSPPADKPKEPEDSNTPKP